MQTARITADRVRTAIVEQATRRDLRRAEVHVSPKAYAVLQADADLKWACSNNQPGTPQRRGLWIGYLKVVRNLRLRHLDVWFKPDPAANKPGKRVGEERSRPWVTEAVSEWEAAGEPDDEPQPE